MMPSKMAGFLPKTTFFLGEFPTNEIIMLTLLLQDWNFSNE